MTLHPIQVLDHVLDEYEDYLRTEFRAKDEQLREALRMEIDRPLFLAQEPFYQAHRPFKSGKPWRELPLDPRLAKTMEKRSDSTTAFLHQSESIAHLLSPGATPVVVTTGTGSGKTECFLLPVIQNAIEDGSRFRKNGLTAILVYPMNALANDQIERIHEYLEDSGFTGVLKVEKYDRGTDQAKREEMRRNPPHLLLTNYVMLEYLLTRPADRDAIFANHRCRFLVLDEVHTYRGSLGSNIGLLVRRLRAHLRAAKQDWGTDIEADRERRFPKLVPIGTSTIKSLDEENLPRAEIVRRRDASVQGFFAALTGEAADSIRILGEELREVTPPPEARYPTPPPSVASFDVSDAEAVRRAVCALAGIRADRPLDEAARSARILWNLGAWLIHRPMSVPQIVQRLRETVPERRDVRADLVRAEVEAALAAGCALPEKTLGALRLRAHRFLRGGWSFYRCVSPECGRIFPMGEGTCACGRQAAPLYLCRACGASYLGFLEDTEGTGILRPGVGTKDTEWLLYDPARHEGGLSFEDEDDEEEDEEANGRRRRGARRQPAPGNRPTQVRGRRVREGSFDPRTLTFDEDQETYPMRAVLAPGRTRCMCCGSTAGSRSIITPVSLGTSAAVKVIGEGLVESLAEANRNREKHDGKERLLVFSDSRQDAAHQARFLIFAGRYDRMRRRVVSILQNEARRVLPLGRLVELLAGAARPGDNPFVPEGGFVSNEVRRKIEGWEEAPLLDDLALSASYRATLLNLGLVGVDYQGLADHTRSAGREIATSLGLTTEQLEHVCRALLDEMRRRGALNREMLTYHPMNLRCPEYARSAEWERRIKQPQGYACDERGRPTAFLDQNAVEYGIHVHNFWRRPGTGGRDPSFGRILKHLCARFAGATPTPEQAVGVVEFLRGFVMPTTLHGARESSQLIQVAADTVHLALLTEAERQRCGTCGAVQPFRRVGSPCMRCHGTLTAWRDGEVRESRTVRRILEPHTQPLVAREHTAQVPQAERADLESWFKQPPTESPVNVLACSPTLEMGIDVGGLDAVVLRNVPPRPDNYAQRGGRAGRRTRVGLVVGYTRNTPHDQYFFDKPEEMIAGEVPAPLVPLNNRDIILRHLASVAFGLADPGLAGRMIDYVTATGELND
jgi:Lhr-like helicase